MIKSKLSYNLILLWLLVWPWNTKFIIAPAATNYLEIAFYLSSLFLLIPLTETIIGLIKNFRSREQKTQIRPLWWRGSLIIFIVAALSLIWAPNQPLAAVRADYLIAGLLVFIGIKQSPPFFRRRAGRVFLLGLIAPTFLGIGQFIFQFAPASKLFGLAAHYPADLGVSVIETGAGRFLRAYGSFDHPNIFGGLMALASLLAFYWGLKETNKKIKFFIFASGLLFSVGLLVSFSRSAFLAFALGFLALTLSQRKIIWQRGKSFLIGGAILLTLFIALCSPLLLVRTNPESRLEVKSLTERRLFKEQAQQIIKQRPVRGVGLGGYIPTLMLVNPSLEPWNYQPVHNYWLLVWAELGIFGLFGFIIFWLGILQGALKINSGPFGWFCLD